MAGDYNRRWQLKAGTKKTRANRGFAGFMGGSSRHYHDHAGTPIHRARDWQVVLYRRPALSLGRTPATCLNVLGFGTHGAFASGSGGVVVPGD
jgi:hypothetical protein